MLSTISDSLCLGSIKDYFCDVKLYKINQKLRESEQTFQCTACWGDATSNKKQTIAKQWNKNLSELIIIYWYFHCFFFKVWCGCLEYLLDHGDLYFGLIEMSLITDRIYIMKLVEIKKVCEFYLL